MQLALAGRRQNERLGPARSCVFTKITKGKSYETDYIMAAARRVRPGRLDVSRRIWADPHVLPGRRDHQGPDPGDRAPVAHRGPIRPQIPEATPAAPAPGKPTSTAPAGGKKMSVPGALKDNENRWSAALAKHDTATIESMVAADFIGVNSTGKVQNRRAMLAEVKSDKDTYTSAKAEKLDVHMYGSSVAVVVGMANEKGTGKDGKAFDRTYRFTDTWMDRGGN